MKKINKLLIMLLTLTCFAMCGQGKAAFASEIVVDADTQKLMDMFPQFEESLKKHTTGELAGKEETYVKITDKEDTTDEQRKNKNMLKSYTLDELEEDYNVEYFTKEEFEHEFNKSSRGIGSQTEGKSSWLVIDLQVYYGSGSTHYMAYNFCRWLTSPKIRLTNGEAIGISVSEGMVISGDNSTRNACYQFANPYSPYGGHQDLSVSVGGASSGYGTGRGVLSVTSLQPANVLHAFPNLNEYHNFMVSTGVSFIGNGINQGWIFGNYAHKQVGLGSFGIDATGLPSIGIGASIDKVTGCINVTR